MVEKILDTFEVKYLQIMDKNGNVDETLMPSLSNDEVLEMYKLMVLSRVYDDKLLALQRTGRIGTFAQVRGQEACQVASCKALGEKDWVVPAFREIAAAVALNLPLENLILFNGGDERGNQIPDGINILPVSIPVAAQLLHATGLAWSFKLQKKDQVVLTFCGDGGTSEGEFHEALNFAGVYNLPVIFAVQNNQYAISLPVGKQTASKTIAQKAIAYGINGILVDGNDVFACYKATKQAIDDAKKGIPTLIEFYTYRLANHTTSDDAKKYRSEEELKQWEQKDPILRLKKYLIGKKLWSEDQDIKLIEESKIKIEKAVENAENISKPELIDMFKYTYKEMTPELKEQYEELKNA